MSTVKERLLLFLKHKHLSQAKFEKLCNLSNGYVNNMRKGFSVDKLQNVVSAFPELNREWLVYGEGDMLNPSGKITNIQTSGRDSVFHNDGSGSQTEALKTEIEYLKRMMDEKDARIALLTRLLDGKR